MKRNVLKTVSLVICGCFYFFTSGCASIVSGGLQTVPINSTPANAKLEITDINTGQCILSTNTPFSASLKRDSGYFSKSCYKIRVSKEGYAPKEVTLEAGVNGWYFGNILFGGLIGMLIVDPATGAMWSLSEDPINISLVQEPVSITTPVAAPPVRPADPSPVITKPKNEYSEIINAWEAEQK